MGAIKIHCSSELILRGLHIDDIKYSIRNIKMINDRFGTVEIVLSGEEFPEVEYGEEPILVSPIIHYETYSIDWNIPKSE